METKIRFTVDADCCARAIEELYAMLLRQEVAFRDRWRANARIQFAQNFLRVVGMVLSLVGLGLAVWMLTQSRLSAYKISLVAIFIAFFAILNFLPRWLPRLQSWTARRSENRCRRRAQKSFKGALKLVPYEAEYDVKGDLVVYSRGKDGEWNVAWHRKLSKFRERGMALQSPNLTVIFRKPNSFLPEILILCGAQDWAGELLREVGISTTSK